MAQVRVQGDRRIQYLNVETWNLMTHPGPKLRSTLVHMQSQCFRIISRHKVLRGKIKRSTAAKNAIAYERAPSGGATTARMAEHICKASHHAVEMRGRLDAALAVFPCLKCKRVFCSVAPGMPI